MTCLTVAGSETTVYQLHPQKSAKYHFLGYEPLVTNLFPSSQLDCQTILMTFSSMKWKPAFETENYIHNFIISV